MSTIIKEALIQRLKDRKEMHCRLIQKQQDAIEEIEAVLVIVAQLPDSPNRQGE